MNNHQLVQILAIVVGFAGALIVGLLLLKARQTGILPTRFGAIDSGQRPWLFRFAVGTGLLGVTILLGAGLSAMMLLMTGVPTIPGGLRLPDGFENSRLPWMLAGVAMAVLILIIFAALRRIRRSRGTTDDNAF